MYHFLKKHWLAACGICVFLWALSMLEILQKEIPGKNTLTIGLQNGYPPFEFVNPQGEVVGFDVDVAEQIAKHLNKTLVVKEMGFEGLILSLQQEKIDLIMSGMNITPSRLKEIAMVPYHGAAATSLSLVFWENIPEGISTLEEIGALQSPVISVGAGEFPETYLARFPQIQAKAFDGTLNALMDVKFGKSLAVLVEPDVAEYLKNKYSEIKVITVPLAADDQVMGFGIGIKKGNDELFQQVEQSITDIKNSGTMQSLENKWFKEKSL